MKKIFVLMLFISSMFFNDLEAAIGVGDQASPGSLSCYSSKFSKCYITKNSFYNNMAALCVYPSGSMSVKIVERPNTVSCRDFFIPDPVDDTKGYGVVNGFMQYIPNDPTANAYFYVNNESSIFSNFESWSKAANSSDK